jgi:hypothetical protein
MGAVQFLRPLIMQSSSFEVFQRFWTTNQPPTVSTDRMIAGKTQRGMFACRVLIGSRGGMSFTFIRA